MGCRTGSAVPSLSSCGTNIYLRGAWKGSAWTDVQVLRFDSTAAGVNNSTPETVPALPLSALLSLGGLLGLFGVRRLGRR